MVNAKLLLRYYAIITDIRIKIKLNFDKSEHLYVYINERNNLIG